MIAPGSFATVWDLADFEYDIPCEWEDGCDNPATVMSKACGDDQPHAICQRHLAELRQWFDSRRGRVCVCGRPFLFFDTHYSIMEL